MEADWEDEQPGAEEDEDDDEDADGEDDEEEEDEVQEIKRSVSRSTSHHDVGEAEPQFPPLGNYSVEPFSSSSASPQVVGARPSTGMESTSSSPFVRPPSRTISVESGATVPGKEEKVARVKPFIVMKKPAQLVPSLNREGKPGNSFILFLMFICIVFFCISIA